MIHVTPVILCGGAGTRLWPLSRSGFPKQFLCLTGNESLFQQAARRLHGLAAHDIGIAQPVIVCNEEHRFLAAEQLREVEITPEAALLEPVGRNTAPALTLAAFSAMARGEDPVLVVIPADQSVRDAAAYTAAVQAAIREATHDNIVIFGVVPTRPETGYGYIQADTAATAAKPALSVATAIATVKRFVEKPDAATAQRYLEAGDYFWNAGMFVLKASVWLNALQTFRPEIARGTQAAWDKRATDKNTDVIFVRPDKAAFSAIPSESIDYAVMEHCPGSAFPIKMAPLNAGWSDLGAWDAVWDVLPKDAAGNAHLGDVLMTESQNTLVHATSRLVSLVGVKDIVVIETPDAVLVADKSRSQEVKQIVGALVQKKREEPTLHRKVHRPWGWYDSIDEGHHFKVKRIQVRPHASLSLQKHKHRAEHWVVVKGTAEITCGDKTIVLGENQSTYIPLGEKHRLTNPGTVPLEIIEVQSGDYLGEDDIIRFEDRYGREGRES